MAMGLFCFLSGVIDDQYMDARGWKQLKTLVIPVSPSLPLEGEVSVNLKAALVAQSIAMWHCPIPKKIS